MTADVLEKDLQRTVIELAQVCGWTRIYHTHDSRRSQEGFPDLVLVRERIVFLELKREKTKTTPAQKEWLRALRDASGEVYLIRPSDLDRLAAVLKARYSADPPYNAGWFAANDLLSNLALELS